MTDVIKCFDLVIVVVAAVVAVATVAVAVAIIAMFTLLRMPTIDIIHLPRTTEATPGNCALIRRERYRIWVPRAT